MKPVILCPYPAELKAVIRFIPNLKKHSAFSYESPEIKVLGLWGLEQANLAHLFENSSRENPYFCIILGTAGALTTNLPIGAVFCAKEVLSETSDGLHNFFPIPGFNCETFLTVENEKKTQQDREVCFQRFKTPLVEMEAFKIKSALDEKGLTSGRISMVRIISDNPEFVFSLPFDNNIINGFKLATQKILNYVKSL